MKKIIFATGNEDKMKEIRRILADPSLEILSLKDAGIHADIDENGKSACPLLPFLRWRELL